MIMDSGIDKKKFDELASIMERIDMRLRDIELHMKKMRLSCCPDSPYTGITRKPKLSMLAK